MEGKSSPSLIKCKNLTEDEYLQISLAQGITAIVCACICSIAVVVFAIAVVKSHCMPGQVALPSLQVHQRRKRRERIILYLLVATLGALITQAPQPKHFSKFGTEDNVCSFVGYLSQVFGLSELVISLWAAVYLYFSIFTTLRQAGGEHVISYECCSTEKSKVLAEISLVTLTVFALLAIAALPFLVMSDPYGDAGPWCWIKSLQHDCTIDLDGFGLQLGLWYIPNGFVGLTSVVSIALVICHLFMACQQVSARDVVNALKHNIAWTIILVTFLVSYLFLWCVHVVGGVTFANSSNRNNFNLWLFWAVSTPVSRTVLPVAFLVYLVQKKIPCCQCCQRTWDHRRYSAIPGNFWIFHTRVDSNSSSEYATCNEPITTELSHQVPPHAAQ